MIEWDLIWWNIRIRVAVGSVDDGSEIGAWGGGARTAEDAFYR